MWLNQSKPILALAPMAKMTDGPFGRVCRDVAGRGFVIFREMASVEAIARDSSKTLKMCEFDEAERPIVLQLFGADAKTIRQAARIVTDGFRPDGIDVNMGCPAPKIAGRETSPSLLLRKEGTRAGAALIRDPERATAIVRELKKENLGIPISVKTRLGWSREEEILEFAPRIEEAGVDAIEIHGRTKIQGYGGKANWDMIGKVKSLLKIPVIANGDIMDTKSVQRCLEITGADGVMIGRGALGKPWVFLKSQIQNPLFLTKGKQFKISEVIADSEKVDMGEIVRVVLRHANLHLTHYGERGMVTFRKHLAWYFKANKIGTAVPKLKELRSRLVRINSMGELTDLLQTY